MQILIFSASVQPVLNLAFLWCLWGPRLRTSSLSSSSSLPEAPSLILGTLWRGIRCNVDSSSLQHSDFACRLYAFIKVAMFWGCLARLLFSLLSFIFPFFFFLLFISFPLFPFSVVSFSLLYLPDYPVLFSPIFSLPLSLSSPLPLFIYFILLCSLLPSSLYLFHSSPLFFSLNHFSLIILMLHKICSL